MARDPKSGEYFDKRIWKTDATHKDANGNYWHHHRETGFWGKSDRRYNTTFYVPDSQPSKSEIENFTYLS